MVKKKGLFSLFNVDRKTALELLKMYMISGTISFSSLMISLILLWHWNYKLVFWILLGLTILGCISYTSLTNKLFRKVVKLKY